MIKSKSYYGFAASSGISLGLDDASSLDSSSLGTEARLRTAPSLSKFMPKSVSSMVSMAAVSAAEEYPWSHSWSRDDILRVWQSKRYELTSDEDRRAMDLLLKYNGPYEAYAEALAMADWRRTHGLTVGNLTHQGHVKFNVQGKLVTKDVDLRAREVLREIDRAVHNQSDWMDSDVLRANDQRFPTRVLRVHLEDELDNILKEQILDRERAERLKTAAARGDSDSEGDPESDEEAFTDKAMKIAEEKAFAARAASRAQSRQGRRRAAAANKTALATESGLPKEVENMVAVRIEHRAARRAKLRHKSKQSSLEKEVYKNRKFIRLKNLSGDVLAEAMLLNRLGAGGCVPCKTNPCCWQPCIEVDLYAQRKLELQREIERVKRETMPVLDSKVCMSAQLGGGSVFRRMDLLDELANELRELEMMVQLNDVDKELHDAYASRKEYIEVTQVHGYATVMWTNHARAALQLQQSRLVARTLASEVVDHILDVMLEGWHFGEWQPDPAELKARAELTGAEDDIEAMRGSLDKLAKINAKRKADVEKVHQEAKQKQQQKQSQGLGQRLGQGQGQGQGRRRKSMPRVFRDRKASLLLPPPPELSLITQLRKDEGPPKKVARDGNSHERMLNQTESKLKFGLFMITVMYFRSIYYLRRNKKLMERKQEAAILTSQRIAAEKEDANEPVDMSLMSLAQIRALEEEQRARARRKKIESVMVRQREGEIRRREREALERYEALYELQEVVRLQKQESESVKLLQRVYRGHMSRRAATRWALKHAEMRGVNALLQAAAVAVQRRWRAYLGRDRALRKRETFSHFIGLQRTQESALEEEIYYDTHKFARWKKEKAEKLKEDLETYLPALNVL
jgi:hypothetical protein